MRRPTSVSWHLALSEWALHCAGVLVQQQALWARHPATALLLPLLRRLSTLHPCRAWSEALPMNFPASPPESPPSRHVAIALANVSTSMTLISFTRPSRATASIFTGFINLAALFVPACAPCPRSSSHQPLLHVVFSIMHLDAGCHTARSTRLQTASECRLVTRARRMPAAAELLTGTGAGWHY